MPEQDTPRSWRLARRTSARAVRKRHNGTIVAIRRPASSARSSPAASGDILVAVGEPRYQQGLPS